MPERDSSGRFVSDTPSETSVPQPVGPENLKQLPKRQIGVREGANVRMILMAQPICPIDDLPFHNKLINGEVVEVPNPKYTGELNCQNEFSGAVGWWEICMSRNHDPYYTTKYIRREEDVVEVQEDGTELVVESRMKKVRLKILNVARVAAYTRVSGGRGPLYARVLKGFRDLSDMGYEPVCEFRNCELPVTVDSRYGKFCGQRHARLIGADVEIVFLESSRTKRAVKEKQLKEIDISPMPGGQVLLEQSPQMEGEGMPDEFTSAKVVSSFEPEKE